MPHVGAVREVQMRGAARSDRQRLRALAIATGIGWAIAFVVLGLHYQLQTYGDGSIFSYSIAVRDAWAFHFHNISGRLFAYLIAVAPSEIYVGLTGDARGGIALYGILFFGAPLAGLALTYAADRSPGRIIFAAACLSTACLCPLVFGFPTEMWMAHALFWPALALCHFARRDAAGHAAVFAILLSLIFTHAGSAIFIVSILLTLWLRGRDDRMLGRTLWTLVPVLAIWLAVRTGFAPDDYFAPVLARAAWHVFDWRICISRMVLLFATALGGYAVLCYGLRRITPRHAPLYAVAIVAVFLASYWVYAINPVHAERRYYLRTLLILFTPVAGILAAAFALQAQGLLQRQVPYLTQLTDRLKDTSAIRAILGAIAVVMVIHIVETGKFVTAWSDYRIAVRKLAMGTASDPSLGDARFVSSARIDRELNRLSWWSTTPYLSVLVTPDLAPARIVFAPDANYFWLSCETATRSAHAQNPVPQDVRHLIAKYSCKHRR